MPEQDFKTKETEKRILVFWRIAIIGLPTLVSFILMARYISRVFISNWVFVPCIYLFTITFILTKVKREDFFNFVILSDIVATAILLYFFTPIWINTLGSGAIVVFICYAFYISYIFNLYVSKRFIYFFVILSILASCILISFEYFAAYPKGPNYFVNNHFVKNVEHLVATLIVVVGGLLFFAFQSNGFLDALRRKAIELDSAKEELSGVNLDLDEKVQARTRELEEAKSVLEIKVQAREGELKILASNLEEQVKERTKALEKKAEELQEVNRSIIARELKMIKIKKGIKNANI